MRRLHGDLRAGAAGYTGRQALDEEVLTELAGMTNFDHYWCEGKPPEQPIYIDTPRMRDLRG